MSEVVQAKGYVLEGFSPTLVATRLTSCAPRVVLDLRISLQEQCARAFQQPSHQSVAASNTQPEAHTPANQVHHSCTPYPHVFSWTFRFRFIFLNVSLLGLSLYCTFMNQLCLWQWNVRMQIPITVILSSHIHTNCNDITVALYAWCRFPSQYGVSLSTVILYYWYYSVTFGVSSITFIINVSVVAVKLMLY